MVDDLEERLSQYRADLDAALAADLTRRHLASREAGFNDANPLQPDIENPIRLEPTMSARYDRRRVMLVATLGVAAAVTLVFVALVASRDDDATPADQPTPTVTVPPTLPPQALPNTHPEDDVAPGTYFVDNVDDPPIARIFVTIGPGWWNWPAPGEPVVGNESIGYMTLFSKPARVFADACHWDDGYRPGPVTTLDGLVAALSDQAGWADVTTPSDISVDGHPGQAFQRTAPDDMSDCGELSHSPRLPQDRPGRNAFLSWEVESGTGGGLFYEKGEVETVWVLDIDGTVVVIYTRAFPEASAAGRAELAAMLDSIRIHGA